MAFPYGATLHHDEDYVCATTKEEGIEYGAYIAMASADVTNQYGTEFKTHVYIFMGNMTHIFFDDPEGGSQEIPIIE